MASDQVTSDRYKQPEPQDEDEHRERVHQEISISKAFLQEKHLRTSLSLVD
jgi:hypothetical protein